MIATLPNGRSFNGKFIEVTGDTPIDVRDHRLNGAGLAWNHAGKGCSLRSMSTPDIYLIRHGETEWSLSGKHTGVSDIPLTEHGRQQARLLQRELATNFQLVLTSPLRRARETCELAGLGRHAEIDPDLAEWNYGDYEGLTSEQIHAHRPAWTIFNDGGGPGGETPEQVGVRVDRVIARVREVRGDVVLFAHGHVLRVFAARWLGLPPTAGAHFLLDTATLCVLSSDRGIAALKHWNVGT